MPHAAGASLLAETGERLRLYPMIYPYQNQPTQVDTSTDMLLGMDNSELLRLIKFRDALI